MAHAGKTTSSLRLFALWASVTTEFSVVSVSASGVACVIGIHSSDKSSSQGCVVFAITVIAVSCGRSVAVVEVVTRKRVGTRL